MIDEMVYWSLPAVVWWAACSGKALSQPNCWCVKFFCWRRDTSLRLGFCDKHRAQWACKPRSATQAERNQP